jgi:hypothetical protein
LAAFFISYSNPKIFLYQHLFLHLPDKFADGYLIGIRNGSFVACHHSYDQPVHKIHLFEIEFSTHNAACFGMVSQRFRIGQFKFFFRFFFIHAADVQPRVFIEKLLLVLPAKRFYLLLYLPHVYRATGFPNFNPI